MTSTHYQRLLYASLLLFTILPAVHAQTTPKDPVDPALRETQANTFIHDALPYWQHRLQLQDWNISILMSRAADLRPGTLGNIHWDAEKKTATIHVLDAADYTLPYPAALKDMEFTIVHELIHLEFASLPMSDENRTGEEFAINHLTDALLQSSR